MSLAALFWVDAVKSEIAGSRGHGCLKFCDLVGHARCGCTGATSGFLSGSTPRGLAGVHQLPMLGLLGRGKTIVDVSGVTLGLDIGHLVDLLLRDEPASTRVTTMSTATAGPAAALTATSTSLSKGQNGAALGNNVILMQALEVAIKVHDRVEVRELGKGNQDSGLNRVEGVVIDPFFEVMDLHGFGNVLNSELKESSKLIVLLHVCSTVLVKVVILAVTTVEQGLEGQNDVAVHGADPVNPKEESVQSTPDLAAILHGRVLLHMLPCRRGGVLGMEDGPNLLCVSEEG